MKLKGEIVDRLRQALGGKTPTPKRIEKLLDEIEQKKATDKRGVMEALQDPAVAVAVGPIEVPVQNFIPPGPDEEEGDEGPEAPPPSGEPAALPAAAALDPVVQAVIAQAEKREAMLKDSIKNMEARIAELAKARLPEEKEAAVGAGKLPVGGPEPGPVGFTGAAALPRGKWFKSPFGPQIDMMLCDCEECLPHRMQHYYCVMCKRGPFDYDPSRGGKAPGGRKVWLAPGSTWGISHETCTATCFQRYMEEVQVVMAQRGQTGASGKIPPKPALVPGSD